MLKKMNLRSSIIAPMKIGNEVIGTVVFISTVEGKRYDQTDLSFAKDFATRIALALENARLHERSQKEIQQRIEAEKKKDEFISVASHELKTPLTTITASIQMLKRIYQRDPLSNFITKLIETSETSTTKLSVLVEDLLNVSNIEAGRLRLNKTIFNVADLINECCSHIQLHDTHQLRIEGDIKLEVFADKQRIDQVIVNLVNNAVKYSPNSFNIVLLLEKIGNKAKVSIIDKGIGIEKDKLPYLFDRYYRVDNSGIQYSGMGLGLYISAEIIKLHAGTVGVVSEKEKGSTFWFTLPLES